LKYQVPASGNALGEALTHDGRYLLVADDAGAVVLSVNAIEHRDATPVVGTLSAPGALASGAIEVAVSKDDSDANVSLEDSAELAVFNLATALANGFRANDFVGMVPLGEAPVGLALSPTGAWLYTTSEVAPGQDHPLASPTDTGTLSVINVARAETDPAGSVVATVDAGRSPVRVIVTKNGERYG
jgi:hypothetical protein